MANQWRLLIRCLVLRPKPVAAAGLLLTTVLFAYLHTQMHGTDSTVVSDSHKGPRAVGVKSVRMLRPGAAIPLLDNDGDILADTGTGVRPRWLEIKVNGYLNQEDDENEMMLEKDTEMSQEEDEIEVESRQTAIQENKETDAKGVPRGQAVNKPQSQNPTNQSREPEAHVVVYSLFQSPGGRGRFTCVPLAANPPAPICLYPDEQDPRVSAAVRRRGLWQPHQVELFQAALEEDPQMGVIDIGANVGQFSMIAASRKREVLAVEPHSDHLRRFNKAAAMGDLQRRIIVLQNVISDRRATVSLHVSGEHPAYTMPLDILKKDDEAPCEVIHMDDLIPYIRFHKAVVVMDTHVLPHRVLAQSRALFDKVEINSIFMDWARVRFYLQHDYRKHVSLITNMVSMLQSRGLAAYDMRGVIPLDVEQIVQWPDLIMWLQTSSKLAQKRSRH